MVNYWLWKIYMFHRPLFSFCCFSFWLGWFPTNPQNFCLFCKICKHILMWGIHDIYCKEQKELLVWEGVALDDISLFPYWMMSALMTFCGEISCQGKSTCRANNKFRHMCYKYSETGLEFEQFYNSWYTTHFICWVLQQKELDVHFIILPNNSSHQGTHKNMRCKESERIPFSPNFSSALGWITKVRVQEWVFTSDPEITKGYRLLFHFILC